MSPHSEPPSGPVQIGAAVELRSAHGKRHLWREWLTKHGGEPDDPSGLATDPACPDPPGVIVIKRFCQK